MSLLYRRLAGATDTELGLIVSGSHLAARFGKTVESVRRDGFAILAEIETLLDSDADFARVNSAGLLMQGSSEIVDKWRPDAILIAGDREEMLAAAMVGTYLRIPVLHFFGGDHARDGNVDNPVRHAISKLATCHFVAHAQHRDRLRAMGERADRIFVVGSPSLDKFVETTGWDRNETRRRLGIEAETYGMLLYHPTPGDTENSAAELRACLRAVQEAAGALVIGLPNRDPGAQRLMAVAEEFRGVRDFLFYPHWEREEFVNLLRHAEFLIGNSSAGIYEAPFLKLPTINVGKRQRGRLAGNNVIWVDGDETAIRESLREVRQIEFRERVGRGDSPYGDGASAERVHRLLRSLNFEHWEKKEDPLFVEG